MAKLTKLTDQELKSKLSHLHDNTMNLDVSDELYQEYMAEFEAISDEMANRPPPRLYNLCRDQGLYVSP